MDLIEQNSKKFKDKGQQFFKWGLGCLGAAFLCFILFMAISGASGSSENISSFALGVFGICFLLCPALGGVGIWLLSQSSRHKTAGEIYRSVHDKIQQGARSLHYLAPINPSALNMVLNDLLQAGFFPGAYIDPVNRRLVLPGDKPPMQPRPRPIAPPRPPAQPPRPAANAVPVFCPHCGGKGFVPKGGSALCAYCEMPVSAETVKK